MLAPCEVAVKTVSPAIRALIAQTLIEKHEMKEIQVAQILGVTQSAVSKYNKKVRGTRIAIDDVPEVRNLTDQMISLLLNEPVQHVEVTKLFCQACATIRSKRLMCPLCEENQNPKIAGCDLCNIG